MKKTTRRGARRSLIAIGLIAIAIPALAHITWKQTNKVTDDTIALYHFDVGSGGAPERVMVAEGLLGGLSLGATPKEGSSFSYDESVPGVVMQPTAFLMEGGISFTSEAVASEIDGDLTIEIWYKFDADANTGFEFGFENGPRMHLMRIKDNDDGDMFSLMSAGGDSVAPEEFFGWTSLHGGESQIARWRHAAVTIHSTGVEENEAKGGTVYKAGSTARFWYYGHQVGMGLTTDLSGVRCDTSSRIVLRNLTGKITIDEATIWRHDWSEDGEIHEPYGDGRG